MVCRVACVCPSAPTALTVMLYVPNGVVWAVAKRDRMNVRVPEVTPRSVNMQEVPAGRTGHERVTFCQVPVTIVTLITVWPVLPCRTVKQQEVDTANANEGRDHTPRPCVAATSAPLADVA